MSTEPEMTDPTEIQRFMDRFQESRGKANKIQILPHVCTPGWHWKPVPEGSEFGLRGLTGGMYGIPPAPDTYPKGTVWRCDGCGQHWVSEGEMYRPGVCGWRRESRRERRRRLGLRWWQREAR